MTQSPNSALAAQQNKGNSTLVLIALALGVVTVILTFLHIQNIRKQTDQQMITVYQLKRDVKPGDKIKENRDIEAMQVPEPSVANIKSRLMTKDQFSSWFDREVKNPASEGSWLTFDLWASESSEGANIIVNEGKRAYALPVNSRTADPRLDINDFVDIRATLTLPGKMTQSMLVMERVRVLRVGDRTVSRDQARRLTGYSNISVEVTPEQARQLATIRLYIEQGRGDFEIDRRNAGDTYRNPKMPNGEINPEILKFVYGQSE